MEFFDVCSTKEMLCSYDPRPIEQDKLQTILEAVNSAPSAGNLPAYEVYIVAQSRGREALAKAALSQEFISMAPVVLVFCTHPARSTMYAKRGRQLYTLQDVTIACAYAMLAATALELASVWIGAFNDEAVRRAIAVAQDQDPVAILPIGYPDETPQATSRRPLADLIHWI